MAIITIGGLTPASSVLSGFKFEVQTPVPSSVSVTSDQIATFVSSSIGPTIYSGV